jgi:hypothetical protein
LHKCVKVAERNTENGCASACQTLKDGEGGGRDKVEERERMWDSGERQGRGRRER